MTDASSFALGLLTAVFWSLGEFFSKRGVKEAELLTASLGMQITGALGVGLFSLVSAFAFPGIFHSFLPAASTPLTVPFWQSFLVGCVAITGVAFCYRSYKLAPLAIASPIVNSKGMFAALVAWVFLSEQAGIPVALGALGCGLGAAFMGMENGGAAGKFFVPGVGSAAVAAVLYGFAMTFSKVPAAAAGAGFTVVSIRVGAFCLMFLLVLFSLGWKGLLPPRRVWGSFLLMGLFDAAGHIAFITGLTRGTAFIVSTLAALSPVLTVVLAVAFYRERLSARQWGGFALVGGGLLLLARAS
ncbi:MAG: DMT family transporter [Bdellovibrionota bacterium]